MRHVAFLSLSAVFVGIFGPASMALADGDVNVYSYRQPELIQPMLDLFTRKTGIGVNVLYLDKGLIERIQVEGENSPADVILTIDLNRLSALKAAGVTQSLADQTIDAAIPAKFRDPDRQWFALGLDARVIYASRARVARTAITYEDLADARWKGKVCLRDGQHASNLGLFADRIAAHGADLTEKWLLGLKVNLSARPSGSDAGQAQAIAEGRCDLALGSATTLAQMLTGAAVDEKAWAEAVRIIYPAEKDGGSYANISGMALARYAPNHANAVKLMEFLVSKEAQALYAQQTLEYPVVAGARPAAVVAAFGTLQPDRVAVSDIARYRGQASDLVDKVGLNDGPGQ